MRTIIVILLCTFMYMTSVFAKTIRKPSFEARNTTTILIDSIEFRKDLTRIYATCHHLPGHWMVIHSNLYIVDPDSGKEWKAFDIDGTDFDRKFQVSEQGTAYISIDFPPIPENLKYIDIYEKSKELPIRIINISLFDNNNDPIKEAMNKSKSVPETSVTVKQDTANFKDKILKKGIATLKGHINGFHPRLQFGNGFIYLDNIITKEQSKLPVNIDNYGNFTVNMPLYYPVQQTIFFPQGYINFYIEPDDTLYIETDMEDLTVPFRNIEDIEKQSKHTQYYGKLAQVNNELRNIRISSTGNIQETATDIPTLTPVTFKEKYTREYHQQQEKLKSWLTDNNISPKSTEIALLNQKFAYARMLLDYETYHFRRSPNQIISPEYYQFLRTLSLNKENVLLAADYKLFINRLELSQPLLAARNISSQDLINSFHEIGVNLTPDEKELITFSMQMKSLNDTINFRNFASRMKDFNRKFTSEQILIRENLNAKNTYNIYTKQLGLKPGITLDLLYSRKFIPRLNALKRQLTPDEFHTCTFYIKHPLLNRLTNEINSTFDFDKVSNDTRCNLH